MSEIAISCKNLSKQYRIGERESYKALRDVITDGFALPFRKLRSALTRDEASSNGSRSSVITHHSSLSPNDAALSIPSSALPIHNPQSEFRNSFWALDDVSFEVKRGEVIGIIGRNGAGKSTLLKILSRITKPTKGHATIHGRVGSLLEVGTGFHPELTGRENIYLNAAILGMRKSEVERKFDEIVAFAEVEKFIDTPVKRYSSGMYVRLAFAVAAYMETEILLVDEVLAVGDAQFQKKCLGKMGDVAKHGRTVIFVSHNMVAVRTLCIRAFTLDEGKLIQQGPTDLVVNSYLKMSVGSFTERVWSKPDEAPGNESVRLQSARVVPIEGYPSIITVRTPFALEFSFWNLKPQTRINLSLHVYNEEGVCVFVTTTINEPNWHGRQFPRGLFRSVCEIPGKLLNNGAYRVLLLVVQDMAHIIYQHDNALTFEIQDANDDRGEYHGKWFGTVRPELSWNTELVNHIP